MNQATLNNTSKTLQVEGQSEVKVIGQSKVKVIAMSLWGSFVNRTYGAIRNVNLARVYFPGWTVRIYAENSMNGTTVHEPVPQRILQKLKYLGAEVQFIPAEYAKTVNPAIWHYVVADDPDIERFIVRNPEARFSERDSKVVGLWEGSGVGFHCIRDHGNHARHALVNGLWGGTPVETQKVLNMSMQQALGEYFRAVVQRSYRSEQNATEGFLEKVLWPKVRGTILCHDSISCHEWSNAVGFPWRRQAYEYEYIGQSYDAWGRPMREETRDYSPNVHPSSCEGVTE